MNPIEITESDSGHVEARGFVLQTEQGDWVLYPEPALKSCCREGDLKKGIALSGEVPTKSQGRCMTVQGHLHDNTLHITSTTASPFPFWILLAPLLLLLILLKRKKT